MNLRWLFGSLVLLFVLLIGGAIFTRTQALAVPDQPIVYSHRTHVEAGVQCLYCHANALRSDVAGMPSVQKCMGCHNIIGKDNHDIQILAGYWERRQPIPWNRVNRQPDFVYFSHQAHLGAGISCETCHGDVGNMTVARPVVKMDMGWCLDCHNKQSAEKVVRLADCLTCHK